MKSFINISNVSLKIFIENYIISNQKWGVCMYLLSASRKMAHEGDYKTLGCDMLDVEGGFCTLAFFMLAGLTANFNLAQTYCSSAFAMLLDAARKKLRLDFWLHVLKITLLERPTSA